MCQPARCSVNTLLFLQNNSNHVTMSDINSADNKRKRIVIVFQKRLTCLHVYVEPLTNTCFPNAYLNWNYQLIVRMKHKSWLPRCLRRIGRRSLHLNSSLRTTKWPYFDVRRSIPENIVQTLIMCGSADIFASLCIQRPASTWNKTLHPGNKICWPRKNMLK